MLPHGLIARLRERAADPGSRSDSFEAVRETIQNISGAPRTKRVSMDDASGGAFGGLMQMMAGAFLSGQSFNLQKMSEQVAEDIRTGKRSREEVFGDAQPGTGMEIYDGEVPSDSPGALPPPASQGDIAAAETALGFPLPGDLKQLYADIANGGFGPNTGFLPLADLAARYREFCSEPQGPCGETWPEHLLPIMPVDMGEACYDLKTGRVVCWDQEELVEEEAEEERWDRSFKPWAGSLADWLEKWLGKKSVSEQVADQLRGHSIEMARSAVEACRDMTPEERAEVGLPEVGWEEQVCRNHGADPKDVL